MPPYDYVNGYFAASEFGEQSADICERIRRVCQEIAGTIGAAIDPHTAAVVAASSVFAVRFDAAVPFVTVTPIDLPRRSIAIGGLD